MSYNDTPRIICKHLDEVCHSMLDQMVEFKVRDDGGFLADYLAYKTSLGKIYSPAIEEEVANKARTYLVIDSEAQELAAYFTLKAGLVGFKRNRSLLSKSFDAMPGIEITNFAVNEIYKQAHESISELGYMIFRDFILHKSEEAQRIIGVEILYIYALPRKRLIERYEEYGFAKLIPFQQKYLERHFRPRYDQGCVFMYQNL